MVHLQRLECEGLYSFSDRINAEFTDNIVIVGTNNSGKSNIFRVLQVLIDAFENSSRLSKSQISSSHPNPFSKVLLRFSPDETEKIIDYFSFHYNQQDNIIEHHNFKNRQILLDLFDEIILCLSWDKEIRGNYSISHIDIIFSKTELKLAHEIFALRASHSLQMKDVDLYNSKFKFFGILDTITESKNVVQSLAIIFNEKIHGEFGLSTINVERYSDYDDIGKETVIKLSSYVENKTNSEIHFSDILGKILKKGIIHFSGSKSNTTLTLFDHAYTLKILGTEPVHAAGDARCNFNDVLLEQALKKPSNLMTS